MSLNSLGNPEHPLLRTGYDIVSNIRCKDFSTWVIEQLNENDFDALWAFVDELYTYNQFYGFGISSGFIKEENAELKNLLKEFLNVNFSNYLEINKKAILELQSFYILRYGMDSTNREFWIVVEERSISIAKLLSIYSFSINIVAFNELIIRINSFIKERKKEGGWVEYPYYTHDTLKINYTINCETDLLQKLQSLSIGERFYLFDFAKNLKSEIHFLHESSYITKRFGLDDKEAIKHFVELNLFAKVVELESIPQVVNKSDIKEKAEWSGFEIKKSWTLEKIHTNLMKTEKGRDFLFNYIKNIDMLKFNTIYLKDFLKIIAYQKEIEIIGDLLTSIK